MEPIYKATFDSATGILSIGFGAASSNAEMVPFVESLMADLKKAGVFMGPLLKITGAASLPIGFVIAHHTSHLFGAVACFDPKLAGYVVAVSHNPEYPLGKLIPA
jgi:CRISPR-associated protein Csx3